MKKKGLALELKNLLSINDIAGIRVVCNYVNDIYRLKSLIKNADTFRIIREKDYIQFPKPNGYRSLHLVLEIMVTTCQGRIELPVEVQLRSIAMDLWASLEHELHYKSKYHMSIEDEQRLRLHTTIKNFTKNT